LHTQALALGSLVQFRSVVAFKEAGWGGKLLRGTRAKPFLDVLVEGRVVGGRDAMTTRC
jgi:hypothetical protein